MAAAEIEILVANDRDRVLTQMGLIPNAEVCELQVPSIVNPRISNLFLPVRIVERLRLRQSGESKVMRADGNSVIWPVVRNVWLKLLGRESVFLAVVHPDTETAILGRIVLAKLDLVYDSTTQTLRPRDPDWIVVEIE